MDSIQKALVVILSTSLVSMFLIQKNSIKKNRDQVLVFSVVLALHVLGIVFWDKMYHDKKLEEQKKKEEEEALRKKLEKEMKERAQATKKLEFTSDKVMPIKTYNPKDCTNDGSCIIPANKANLHGLHEKKGTNPFTQHNTKETEGLKKCVRCNRPLTLYNNPPTEDFKLTCKCNYCTRQVKELKLNDNMCIYCKTAYYKSHQCYSPTKLHNALFIE